MFERSLEEKAVSYRTLEFSSGISLRHCLQKGIGVTFCPRISIENELASGSLQILGAEQMATSVIMVWHREKWCSPLLNRFMEISKKLIYDQNDT